MSCSDDTQINGNCTCSVYISKYCKDEYPHISKIESDFVCKLSDHIVCFRNRSQRVAYCLELFSSIIEVDDSDLTEIMEKILKTNGKWETCDIRQMLCDIFDDMCCVCLPNDYFQQTWLDDIFQSTIHVIQCLLNINP